ncbi:MAG: uracil-DNA glycosylase [Blastocatellia bacterium]|jgi:DNA polymerase|nr:uracil-DNA glycosylase [Blastocatellia bacterium]
MSSDSTELLNIVEDTHEYLSYLGELGVAGVASVPQHQTGSFIDEAPSPIATTKAVSPVRAHEHQRDEVVNSTPQDLLFGELVSAPDGGLASSIETFEGIHAEIGDCTRCPLHESRTNVVHTHGNQRARLMFVGEAPGADEDEQARPFVGRAGQLLTKIIEAMGFKREDVIIGNVNRCRPPGNRQPTAEEAAVCKPYLLREIAVVRPEVIVVMGNTAMKNLLNTREGITRVRGKFQDYRGIKVMPTFHPAYLLRDPSKKRETWDDMKKVREYLNESTPKSGAP